MVRYRWIVMMGALALCQCGGEPEGELEREEELGELQQALCKNALTAEQERVALKLIDDICGDTWCEGDYNFRFLELECQRSSRSCRLTFETFPYGDGEPVPVSQHRCRTRGFTGFDSLVATSPNGYQSLVPEFYDALTDCISTVTDP